MNDRAAVELTLTGTPEVGQLAEVRGRRWIVTEVVKSTLPPDPLDPTRAPQHMVRLSSVDEDALGEELAVIWEIEAGARSHEKIELPDPGNGFDSPARLDAFLDAVRWGAVESADVGHLQAPFRSGIAIEDYQLDPVVRALQMPRVNLLIADDVGLGKTIEAGLVAQELMLRQRVRSILIIVPASLQLKWHDEMRDRFGLEFRIIDSEALGDLRRRRGIRVNPWTHFPRLITSIDYLKREVPLRLFRECLPAAGQPIYPRRFDLMILDEAHNVAPVGRGRYSTDSLRTAAIRTLAPHFEHKLFLTATPHNGYKESFSALLELLDDQRFARDVEPDRRQLEAVLVRRLKSEIENWDGTPRFPQRKLVALEIDHSETERSAHELLVEYTASRHEATEDDRRGIATEFVLKLLKKRMFSSPAAFATTLEAHEKTLRGLNRETGRPVHLPATGILRREFERVEEEAESDDEWEDSTEAVVDTATTMFERLSERERGILQRLSDWARQAAARPDTKARYLLGWLDETVRPTGAWNDERVIVFTEYRATQKWLLHLMAARGLTRDGRLLTIYGGMPEDEREHIKAAFQAKPTESPVRILLATDSASEGIDLQNHCHRLIHYEIPWNPNRLEQRNGRIDRHGQKAKEVLVHHFVGRGWKEEGDDGAGTLAGDLEFLARVARKVDEIRTDLGKVGPVIAQQIEEAMLGRRRSLDTTAAERDASRVRRSLTFERQLRERIAQLHERLIESKRALHVSPEHVEAVVRVGLEIAGQPELEDAELDGVPRRDESTRSSVFHLPRLRNLWADCTRGSEHPFTGAMRPVTFDHVIANGRDDVVLVHLNHRLVQMCQRLLRAEVWADAGRRSLHRVTARIVPDELTDSPVVVAHARLLVTGGTDRRLHEEIIEVAGTLRNGRFARVDGVRETERLVSAATRREPSEAVRQQFVDLWPRLSDPLTRALEVRARERTNSLARRLTERADKEASDVEAILGELARTIEGEISGEHPPQLDLFLADERAQWEANRSALERRLDQIPDEIEREVAQVRARYADPTPRLFPVAVSFLVPRSLAFHR